MRKLVMVSVLLTLLNLPGCASTFDTFAAGALLGGALVGCSHYCY